MNYFDKKLYEDITNIIVCGDLHGMLNELVFKINNQYKLTDTACFCAGDIGLGFHKEKYYHELFQKLNPKLIKQNNFLLLIRGNHDDPSYWNTDLFQFSNIIFVQDYTVITIGDKKILCIGGAISVDRSMRTEGKDFWNNEVFKFDETLLRGLSPNIIITHSAPHFVFPYTKEGILDWLNKDSSLEKDINEERLNHTKVYETLKKNSSNLSHWFYGHFHKSHTEYIEQTKFILLNELEFYEVKY